MQRLRRRIEHEESGAYRHLPALICAMRRIGEVIFRGKPLD